VEIHYEEVLYQVYVPLPLSMLVVLQTDRSETPLITYHGHVRLQSRMMPQKLYL